MSFWDFFRNIFRRRQEEDEDTGSPSEPRSTPVSRPTPEPDPSPAPSGRSSQRSSYTAKQFMTEIIRPVLTEIGAHSTAAERLMLGTAAAESLLRERRQRGGGPARGLFQMEPPSHDDIYDNFLDYPGRAVLKQKILATLSSPNADRIRELETNDRYACAMARMQYYRRRDPLPDADDLDGLARYWKRYYNTALGKGTVEGFKDKWSSVVGAFPPRF